MRVFVSPNDVFSSSDFGGFFLWRASFASIFGARFFYHGKDMGVSKNRVFLPQIINFNRVFHFKPSILGYPYFWKHLYIFFNPTFDGFLLQKNPT